MYTCIHPSLIQLIALCISFFVCLTLCRSCNVLVSVHQMPWGGGAAPQLFGHNYIKKYFNPSINHPINLTICLFVFLFIYESRSASLHRQLPIFPVSRDYLYFSIGFPTFLHTILYISLYNSLCFSFLFRSRYISL